MNRKAMVNFLLEHRKNSPKLDKFMRDLMYMTDHDVEIEYDDAWIERNAPPVYDDDPNDYGHLTF